MTFDSEISSILGFQKNESLVTDFVCGEIDDEMHFMEGAIHRDTFCCMGTVGIGVSMI